MTKIPNFADVALTADRKQTATRADWQQKVTGGDEQPVWKTPEHIDVAPLYTATAYDGLDHLASLPGMPPFVRGPYATMYTLRPGPCGSTRASPPPKTPTPSIVGIWQPGRWA